MLPTRFVFRPRVARVASGSVPTCLPHETLRLRGARPQGECRAALGSWQILCAHLAALGQGPLLLGLGLMASIIASRLPA